MSQNIRWISAGLIVIKPCTKPVEILLVKYRLPGNVERYVIEPPKGIVDVNEDLLQAAIRETVEETGLQTTDIEIVHSIKPLVYRHQSFLHSYDNTGIKEVYLYVAYCKQCNISNKTEEADQVFFARIDEAIELITKKQVVDWLVKHKQVLQNISNKLCEEFRIMRK